MTDLKVGDAVKWVPAEAGGDIDHPACFEGMVTGISPNGIRTIVWWGGRVKNQSAVDSRTLVKLDGVNGVTEQLRYLRTSELIDVKFYARELMGGEIGPRLWWLHEVDYPASGAVWTREPDADDIAFVEKESKRKHAVKRLVPV